MARPPLGGWGAGLPDGDLGRALALLGVVATAAREGVATPRPVSPTLADAGGLLADSMERATRDRRNLSWDLRSLGTGESRARILERLPAADLARIWTDAGAGALPLEIQPVRGLDHRWLFSHLLRATDVGVPYVRLPPQTGRLRWHWPIRVGFRASDGERGEELSAHLGPAMADVADRATDPARCDVLITWVDGPPGHAAIADDDLPEAALLIVLETGDVRVPIRAVRSIARRAEAHGVAVVGLADDTPGRAAEWFGALLSELSDGHALVDGIIAAGRLSGFFATPDLVRMVPLRLAGEALVLRLDRARDLTTAEPPPSFDLPLRMLPAFDVAARDRALGPALRELEARAVADRYIRAAVEVRRRGAPPRPVRQGFRAGARHRVSVSIGPREQGLIMAPDAIPPEALADAAGHRLTVVLSEPTLLARPLVRTLELPAFGPSGAAVFELPVTGRADAVHARISVLHRGRILQTAILQGPVLAPDELLRRERDVPTEGAGLALVTEANLRPGFPALDDRRRFQAAIVLNADGAGTHGGTIVTGSKAAQFDFDFVKQAVAGLSTVLERAERDDAFERTLASKPSLAYLHRLATEGSGLYTAIGRPIEQRLGSRSLERLQVLSANANTMLPVELIYDLPPPAPGVPGRLCENVEAVLATGRCEARFHVPDAEDFLPVICPSGFWGITKLIERHATDGTEVHPAFEVRAVGDQRRDPLRPLAPVLLAASDHVNDVASGELKRLTAALTTLTSDRLTPVRTWSEWARIVVEQQPPVMVVLSHTELAAADGPSLEIAKVGGRERRAVNQIRKNYVNPTGDQPGPMVLLLGCTTAVPLTSFQSFTVQFGAMGAAVVIGTIAPVLGRHAGRAAEAILGGFAALGHAGTEQRRGIPVGEALRDVRRSLLARGILMSMSLAAYGDADWRLAMEV